MLKFQQAGEMILEEEHFQTIEPVLTGFYYQELLNMMPAEGGYRGVKNEGPL